MTKIISVHNYSCKTLCEHANVCYFVNGKHKEVDESISDIPDMIEQIINKISGDKQVYYSGCNFLSSYITYEQDIFGHEDERHMTFSSKLYHHMKTLVNTEEAQELFDKNIQLTVYTKDELDDINFNHIQKLFLIKDDETFNIAMDILHDHKRYGNIHFPIAQSWVENNPYKLGGLVGKYFEIKDEVDNITLDSCLMSYVLNGDCEYKTSYIDLRYDGTVRRCPFSDECHNINNYDWKDNPDKMFDIPFEPKCIYKQIFSKTNS